jgi:hypothetical protein
MVITPQRRPSMQMKVSEVPGSGRFWSLILFRTVDEYCRPRVRQIMVKTMTNRTLKSYFV